MRRYKFVPHPASERTETGDKRSKIETYKELTMTYAQQMIQTHPNPSMTGDAVTTCIDACFDCAQACTSCADACLGEQQPGMLTRCIRLDLDCADICDATGKIMSRQTASDPAMVRPALQACAEACRICAEECEQHAEHGMEHCRVCAEACRRCEQACNDLMGELAA